MVGFISAVDATGRRGNTVIPKLHDLGDEGGCHGTDQRAVVQLEHDFSADCYAVVAAVHNQMVAAGIEDLHSGSRVEAARIGVLASDGKDHLRECTPIRGGRSHQTRFEQCRPMAARV